VDFDADGDVVGFDIDHAFRKLDLSKIETEDRSAAKRAAHPQRGKRFSAAGYYSQRLAFFGKPGRCTPTTQKR
jgi:hypothetical protein